MPETNSSLACVLASTYRASAPLYRVFIGTTTPPAVSAPSAATIQSGEFGAHTPTRSPLRTPAAMAAAAARRTRSRSSV
ncbi:hypothetical protein EHYA_00008 [Embleya hyalina]|uniref:Uncharacterized protein n=1 Tax=Embleya hyalina TaxID=516124 RepID=A0A401YCN4_9ACTN|nr:hypothetical protein EHYA_00008 [Embleya hyalina]